MNKLFINELSWGATLSKNPVLILAEILETLQEFDQQDSYTTRTVVKKLQTMLALGESDTLSSHVSKICYESDVMIRNMFAERPDMAAAIDKKHLMELVWDVLDRARAVQRLDNWNEIESSEAAYLRMAAAVTQTGGEFTAAPGSADYSWLADLLKQIDDEVESSSISSQMKIAVRRLTTQTLRLITEDHVSHDLVTRYLAQLAGLLSAAAQAEPDKSRARDLMKWSIRVAGRIAIDVITGVPANALTDLFILAIEGSVDVDPVAPSGSELVVLEESGVA